MSQPVPVLQMYVSINVKVLPNTLARFLHFVHSNLKFYSNHFDKDLINALVFCNGCL